MTCRVVSVSCVGAAYGYHDDSHNRWAMLLSSYRTIKPGKQVGEDIKNAEKLKKLVNQSHTRVECRKNTRKTAIKAFEYKQWYLKSFSIDAMFTDILTFIVANYHWELEKIQEVNEG